MHNRALLNHANIPQSDANRLIRRSKPLSEYDSIGSLRIHRQKQPSRREIPSARIASVYANGLLRNTGRFFAPYTAISIDIQIPGPDPRNTRSMSVREVHP